MCGIFGCFLSVESDLPETLAEVASRCLERRGPDALGVHREPGGLLGMRRLAIIDPEGPTPPLRNESGRFWGVGNGEIYNHSEIRKQLRSRQHLMRTENDLEVLVHLEEENLPDWELGLRGMFAFAVWDSRERALHLARDRFGIKPLFWCGSDEGVIFASTLPALREMLLCFGREEKERHLPEEIRPLAHPEGWRLNREALRWYLDTLCVPAPLTFYEGVRSLPPATRLRATIGRKLDLDSYWTPTFQPKRRLSIHEALPLFEEAFRESVSYHLLSDVPVGAFLSGGLDSGYLVAHAATRMGKALSTYTVGFRETDYSEFPAARQMAESLGTDHHEILLEPFRVDDLPGIVSAMNQPLGDSSAWPTWAISKAVGKERKVALAGDGGDEIWGGYPYYRWHNLGRWLPRLPRLLPIPPFSTSYPARLGRVLGDLFRSPDELYERWHHLDPAGELWNRMLRKDFQQPKRDFDFPSSGPPSFHDQLLEKDVRFYLPSDLLEKVDALSMDHSLEVRVPWLDPVLFETMAHLPARLKINGGITKWLLRKSAETGRWRLPETVTRGGKRGFAIPVHRWISTELKEVFNDCCLAVDSGVGEMMDLVSLRRYYELHRTGEIRLGHHLWAILVLELWLRQNRI